MEACKLLYPLYGDLCAVDVGGATTDVHSVARGSPEIQAILENPEPLAKRTVEGDLGIHVNAGNIARIMGDRLNLELGFDAAPLLENMAVFPRDEREEALVRCLRDAACRLPLSATPDDKASLRARRAHHPRLGERPHRCKDHHRHRGAADAAARRERGAGPPHRPGLRARALP